MYTQLQKRTMEQAPTYLEFPVRVEIWVGIVQAHDHAHQDEVGGHVVQEGAAEHVAGQGLLQRPAQRVLDVPGLDLVRRHLPDLLEAQAVALLVLALPQVEALHQLLRARAAAALSEDRLPAHQLHAAREGVLHAAVLGNSDVFRGNLQYSFN